jgi:hypothetical protein
MVVLFVWALLNVVYSLKGAIPGQKDHFSLTSKTAFVSMGRGDVMNSYFSE